MGYRKLIKFGNSSHIVSLPNYWVKKNKLKKGDLIYFEENGNSELVLSSELKKVGQESKEITIDINNKEFDEIKREVHSAYINNFTTINVVGRNINDRELEVRKIINNLMAAEIVEQSENRITIRDFLDINKISIDNLVRKIDILIRSMLIDYKNNISKEKFESIYRRDHNINKLTFLVYRAVKYSINNPEMAKVYNLDNWKLMNYWQLVDRLERIGDEVKRIARSLRDINLGNKEFKKLIEILGKVENFYVGVMNAYNKQDISSLHKVLKFKDELLKDCDNYFNDYKRKDLVPNIIEKLKDMIDHTRTIGRLLYD